jgi:DNA polymerase-3 subunit chi
MTDIRFYHLKTQTPEEALPGILAKALSAGHRVVVKMATAKEAEALSEALWTYRADSFLPHGSEKDGHAADQPIWITARAENPNRATVLVTGPRATPDNIEEYALSCEMISDHEPDTVAGARARWKAYKDAGHEVTYWQQTETGGWEKKA